MEIRIKDVFSISKAVNEDLQEILQLQYLAYQSEAALLGNKDIPPLKQTLEDITEEYHKDTILKMVGPGNQIIGSFTSTRSINNIRLYQRMGYQVFDHRRLDDKLEFVYLEKVQKAQ